VWNLEDSKLLGIRKEQLRGGTKRQCCKGEVRVEEIEKKNVLQKGGRREGLTPGGEASREGKEREPDRTIVCGTRRFPHKKASLNWGGKEDVGRNLQRGSRRVLIGDSGEGQLPWEFQKKDHVKKKTEKRLREDRCNQGGEVI